MYVIAVANPKGGTGKTTVSLLLAEEIARAGGNACVLDCDPNQNVVEWKAGRDAEGRATPFEVVPRPREDDVVDWIDGAASSYDFLIVDLEGTAAQIVTFVLARADLVLIPFEPSPMEARQAARAFQLVRRTEKVIRRTIAQGAVFTRTNAAFATSEEKAVRRELEGTDVELLGVSLVKRAAFQRIFRDDLLLHELSAREVSNLEAAKANSALFSQAVVELLTRSGAPARPRGTDNGETPARAA